MKANYKQKSFLNLPQKEKDAISKLFADQLTESVNAEEAEMQKVWIMFACVALYEMGKSKDEILVFIGSWKRLYRTIDRMKTKAEQEAFIKAHLPIFAEDYPFDFIDSL